MSNVFTYSQESLEKVEFALSKYPEDRKQSAVMPLLDIAQRQNDGWLSKSAIEHVASYLEMPYIKVFEIVTFYSMYYTTPVGKYFVQVCTTTPCWLKGSDEVVKACKEVISIDQNKLSRDGLFSWMEVECLGACVNAPLIQINDDFYEDLNYENTKNVLQSLIDGNPSPIGSQIGRKGSRAQQNVKR